MSAQNDMCTAGHLAALHRERRGMAGASISRSGQKSVCFIAEVYCLFVEAVVVLFAASCSSVRGGTEKVS